MHNLKLLNQKILMLDCHLFHSGVVATRRIQRGRDIHLPEWVARKVAQKPPQPVASGENTHSTHMCVRAFDKRISAGGGGEVNYQSGRFLLVGPCLPANIAASGGGISINSTRSALPHQPAGSFGDNE